MAELPMCEGICRKEEKMKKYWIHMLAIVFLWIFTLSVQVEAASADALRLNESGTVIIVSQHAAQDGVSSLQFSLSIDSADAVTVEFEFQESSAKVQEFRYNQEEKELNVYIAGTEALFAENTDTLTIGRLVILDGNGSNAPATVSVVADSLQYVYGTELKIMEDLELPGAVQMGPKPQPTAAPQPTQEPAGNNASQGGNGGLAGNNNTQGDNGSIPEITISPQAGVGSSQADSSSHGDGGSTQNNDINDRETENSQAPDDASGDRPGASSENEGSIGEAEDVPASAPARSGEDVELSQEDKNTAGNASWIIVSVIAVALALMAVAAAAVWHRRQNALEDEED